MLPTVEERATHKRIEKEIEKSKEFHNAMITLVIIGDEYSKMMFRQSLQQNSEDAVDHVSTGVREYRVKYYKFFSLQFTSYSIIRRQKIH
jgi:hypothetical protein